jgi:hypothetical protein
MWPLTQLMTMRLFPVKEPGARHDDQDEAEREPDPREESGGPETQLGPRSDDGGKDHPEGDERPGDDAQHERRHGRRSRLRHTPGLDQLGDLLG